MSKSPESDDEYPFEFDPDALAAEVVAAHHAEGGASPYLSNPDKLSTLLRALAMGNYRDTACHLAGISIRTLQEWLQRGEADGDGALGTIYRTVHYAESLAEATSRYRIDKAGRMPQHWPANAWALERKAPDKWGKRGDDGNAPKVIVQIGVRDGDVQVTLSSPPSLPASLPAPSIDAEFSAVIDRVQQATAKQGR